MKNKLLQTVSTLLCCGVLSFSCLPMAQADSRMATIVTGTVTLNGQVIDNTNAKYPLLLYSNITYIPMTYHLSRFMGMTADWDEQNQTLHITAGAAQTAYVAETGAMQSGSVSVVLPSYTVSVNGVEIDNRIETYPIFNYNGVTYFPLTYDYARDAFGWSYQWDAENGLRVNTTTVAAPVSTAPNTGDAALDTALTILNDAYLIGGNYQGMLAGMGNTTTFQGTLQHYRTPSVSYATFSATPFPFFDRGLSYTVNYYPTKGGFTGTELLGSISGEGSITHPLEVDESSETYYIGRCFAEFQFMGARSQSITSAETVSEENDITTWDLTVSSPYESDIFTEYTATLRVNTKTRTVLSIAICTEHYTLTMIPDTV